jgi:hypothetical protein
MIRNSLRAVVIPTPKGIGLERDVVFETRSLFPPGCDPISNISFWKQLLSFGVWPHPASQLLKKIRTEKGTPFSFLP